MKSLVGLHAKLSVDYKSFLPPPSNYNSKDWDFLLLDRLRDFPSNRCAHEKSTKQSQNSEFREKLLTMDFLTTALSGVGISVVGLCLLRSWRARSWGAISRIPHLRDKSLDGKVTFNLHNSTQKYNFNI